MLGFIQTALTYIVPFLLVLTLVVTIHELGHFLVAKRFGVAIDRFAIGFGRALLTWRDKSGVEWRVGWIPLGGYVRFSGDENAASVPDQQDLNEMRREILRRDGPEALSHYLHFKPLWQRALVVAAGPAANFLLAIVLFAALAMTFGDTVRAPRISDVQPNSPAARAGLRAGDLVTALDGRKVDDFESVARYVNLRAGVPIRFTVERGGAVTELVGTPEVREVHDRIAGRQKIGVLGIANRSKPADFRHVRYNPIQAVGRGVTQTWDVLSTTVFYLGRLVSGQVPADQLGGVIGIANASGKVTQAAVDAAPTGGWMVVGVIANLLSFSAVLSVSIGFMNLLPIPVLDGGHLLFYAYEAVARRPLGARLQAAGYRVGLALLLGFMLFATWNDLQRLSVFKFLGGLFS